jgi:8-oxo-dGTP pyrophosphatase MutT (NUDIX family)
MHEQNSNLTVADVAARLATGMRGSLPGGDAHRLMAPRPRPGWDPEATAPAGRAAAVLVPLFPCDETGRAALLVTERTDDLEVHRGQVSFPGGACEEGEDAETTALRETGEELGIDPRIPRMLGRLTPLWIPATGFTVVPVVAVLDSLPPLTPNPDEVARVFEVPVDWLLAPGVVAHEARTADGRWHEVPYFPLECAWLWGATAMMTAELLVLLGWPGPF